MCTLILGNSFIVIIGNKSELDRLAFVYKELNNKEGSRLSTNSIVIFMLSHMFIHLCLCILCISHSNCKGGCGSGGLATDSHGGST